MKRILNTKGQNTAEYAILIAIVIGAVIAMQTYAQRTLQGRIRDASVKLVEDTKEIGETLQYEPYYDNRSSDVSRDDETIETGAGTGKTTNTVTDTANYRERTEYQPDAVERAGSGSGF